MPKLLVFDLDNTLLNEKKELTEFSRSTLSKCTERSIKIAFATARSLPDIVPLIGTLNVCAIISSGGSQISLDGDKFYNDPIDCSDCMKIVNELSMFDGVISLKFVTSDIIFSMNRPLDIYQVCNPNDISIYKITVSTDNANIYSYFKSAYRNCAVFSYSDSNAFMITNIMSTKFTALLKTIKLLQIDIKDVVAFGDDDSDLDMINAAGIGVVVRNGKRSVKEYADFICDENYKDGVAHWINNNLFKSLC